MLPVRLVFIQPASQILLDEVIISWLVFRDSIEF